MQLKDGRGHGGYIMLSVEDRCVHKLWKARLHGYEECKKTFQCIDDEKSPEWNKFLGLVKEFVIDSNAAAQEKGLEAVLAYVKNAAVAGKTTNEVMSGIVNKCIAAPKAKIKELAVQITLMYVEIEKHEAVQEELMKGTEAKNPKIISACINILTLALREFGPKVIDVKPLMKKIPALLEDRDKTVRDETKALVVEIYRWIGAPLKQQLDTLKPVQLLELEKEFKNLGNEKATVKRYLRSQKPKVTCLNSSNETDSGYELDNCDNNGNQSDVDPYELLNPKLPKDFFEKIESKKWPKSSSRLKRLDELNKLRKEIIILLESNYDPNKVYFDFLDIDETLYEYVKYQSSQALQLVNEGHELVKRKNYYEALEMYVTATVTFTGNPIIYYFQAQCAFILTMNEHVVDCCDAAIKLKSNFDEAYLLRAKAHMEMSNYELALKDLTLLDKIYRNDKSIQRLISRVKTRTLPIVETLEEAGLAKRMNSPDETFENVSKLIGEIAMERFIVDLYEHRDCANADQGDRRSILQRFL